MLEWILAAASVSPSADLERGRAAFERCAACHGHAEVLGDRPVGPPLQSLRGRRAGSMPGFRYSGPMARSGLVWDPPTLAAFLRDPQGLVPGNRMAFSGLDDETELQALLNFLLREEPTATSAATP